MDTDDRFKHLASDPRFKTLRKKERKVQIDDRFKSMFTDERFTLKYNKDKRGRNQKKTSGDDLKRYYALKDEANNDCRARREEEAEPEEIELEQDEIEVDSKDEKDDDEGEETDNDSEQVDKDDEEEETEDDAASESEYSSSSDEPESEPEFDEIDARRIDYDWQPLDHDAEKAESTSRRLAIQNLDWDRLDVRDLYILVNSIRPPQSVRIYVSEFGKERLAKEAAQGPEELLGVQEEDEEEKELKQLEAKMKALEDAKNPMNKLHKKNEYEDADEAVDLKDEKIRERIRRYQLSRMKYYYAIVDFESTDSAEAVYKELDGLEYEGSSLELDLRFVPDDMEFDNSDLKSSCDKMPDPTSYKAPQFINSALQQTTVKFTWDETDIKRQEKLHRAYTKQELEKDDLDVYLASDSESSEEEDLEDTASEAGSGSLKANSEARVNKYKMLLKSLEEEEEQKKNKVDVDVEWGNFDGDEEAVKNQAEQVDSDTEGDYEDEEKEEEDRDDIEDTSALEEDLYVSRKRKVNRQDDDKKKKRKRGKKSGIDRTEDDDLDLLVLDMDARKQEEFKFNPDDDRFAAVYKSGLYNIDPSHPNFERTKAFEMIAEKKREKRRKANSLGL